MDSRILNDIGMELFIFILQNCPSAKQAFRDKKTTSEIISFTKSELYQNYKKERMKWIYEILRHKEITYFDKEPWDVFETVGTLTNDNEIFIIFNKKRSENGK